MKVNFKDVTDSCLQFSKHDAIEIKSIIRERTTRTRTDMIRYEYSSIHNGRYRYSTTPCVGVPATCNIRLGRSLRERSLYAMGGTYRPLATHKLARSVSFMTG